MELFKFAGKIGWSKAQLYELKWNELTAIIEGYYEQEKDRQFSTSAYLLRRLILTEIQGNPYIKQEFKPHSESEIMEFPTDLKREVKQFTQEEISLMAKKWGMA